MKRAWNFDSSFGFAALFTKKLATKEHVKKDCEFHPTIISKLYTDERG